MIEAEARRRILLVGAGRRVQNNFLPSLACLKDRFEIVGIHSRTPSRLAPVANQWGVPAVERLEDFDLSGIDAVAVSVPTAQNGPVLARLAARAETLDLVIDTPIAWNTAEISNCAPFLETFKSVTVAEDYMNFPRFALARQVVRQGLIGELLSLTLNNIGYLYHGLALIRSFVGFDRPTATWRRALGGHAAAVGYEFEGGFSAVVVGPYRRHAAGGLFVEGRTGIITEFPVDRDISARGKRVFVLSPMIKDGALAGFECRGDDRYFALDLPDVRRMRQMSIADKSDLNLERGAGLITVLNALTDTHNLNHAYGADDAFHDSLVSQRADRGEAHVPWRPWSPRPAAVERSGGAWIAREATVLKRETRLAAELPGDQKRAVPAGARLEADGVTVTGGHLMLTGVRLDGAPIDGKPWFIFAAAWERA
jgi:hypothetical protein